MIKHMLKLALFLCAVEMVAQIRVEPAVVNVNSQGASTVFLSYGSIRPDQFSVEAIWCADLVPAAPDIGVKCDPARTWGRLPLRNDLARPSGSSGFTDIMTIPQNVARRAYESAASGSNSSFYYVRKFSSSQGLPDEYIAILLRLTGGGAKVPLALTDVKVRFSTEKNVLSVPVGEKAPPLHAELTYTGTGRLIGRWEVVLPGDEPPSREDLLPESSLPIEQRATQKRYTQLGRFNVFLPPDGRYRLEGPDVSKLPTAIEGLYSVLLRIEASDDGEGNTDLGAVGAGTGVVSSGGVAGFPMPALRYYVGARDAEGNAAAVRKIEIRSPKNEVALTPSEALVFEWDAFAAAEFYQVEVKNSSGAQVISAVVAAPASRYTAPPFLRDQEKGRLSWSVTATSNEGKLLARSSVETFRLGIDDKANDPAAPSP
jgi:hypothetical protein